MNHLMLAGNLGNDPEVRYTSSGLKVVTLRLATHARRSGKDETIWWRVTLWGEQFDKMLPHLKKGTSLIVFGDLSKPEIYTDREGKPQVSLNMTANSIQFSPFGKPQGASQTSQPQAQGHSQFEQPPKQNYEEVNYFYDQSMQGQGAHAGAIADEEIPF